MKAVRLVAAACLALSACGRAGDKTSLTLSGTVELTERQLGARVTGRLAGVSAEEGDAVRAGQVLATLDRHEQARRDHERVVREFEKGGASRKAVEHAALALEDQSIVSPVDGLVLVKVHEAGAVVGAGAPVFVVGDRKNPWVRVFVPEGAVNRVRVGAPAGIRLDGLAKSFSGKVSFIAPQAEFTPRNVQTKEERVTQTFAVKVAFDESAEGLRPGVAADVTLELGPP